MRVAHASDVRGDRPHAISAGGVDLVLVRGRSGLRVYEGRCPHQGALLGEGEVESGAIVCRNHRWRFDIETGRRSGGTECIRPCAVREDGGDVWVDPYSITSAAAAATGGAVTQGAPTRRLQDLPGPRPLPVVGNAFQVDLERMHLVLEGWAAKYGPMYVARLGVRKILVLSDAELVEPLYRARPDIYRRPSQIEPIFEDLRLAGVFSAEGDAWRAQRRLAMEALSMRHLRGFYPVLAQVTQRLLGRWAAAADAGRVLDVADELKRFTVDVTTRLVFGLDLNTLEKGDEDVIQRHLEHIFPALNRRLNAVFPYWRYFRLPADRRVDHAVREVYKWLTSVIEEARARLSSTSGLAENPANFIEAMLAARDGSGRPFSDDVIFGNAMTMLLAGEDTTAYTLAWAVHHVCDDARVAAALRAEADSVIGGAKVPTDVEQAQRLAYASGVANESMRLRPVAPTPFFEPTADVVVGDVAVPKGSTIIALSRMATRDSARFGAPLEFRPERWMDGGSNGEAHDPSVHLPFGSGPRMCPGRALALLEMRVALCAIYKNFDVERAGASSDVREHQAFTMGPMGLRVRVRRRAAVEPQAEAPGHHA